MPLVEVGIQVGKGSLRYFKKETFVAVTIYFAKKVTKLQLQI